MSHTPVEQSVMDLIVLFHKYSKPDDKIDKQGLLKMLKENFPIFLKACQACQTCGPLVPCDPQRIFLWPSPYNAFEFDVLDLQNQLQSKIKKDLKRQRQP